MILDGTKTLEIRGSSTKIRGRIYLIKSASGKIYGTAELVDCFKIPSRILRNYESQHKLSEKNLITIS